MGDPVLLLRIHRFVDESGEIVEVVIAPEVAAVLDERRRNAKERRRKTREVAFTDLRGKKRSSEDKDASTHLSQDEIDKGHKRRISRRKERDDAGNPWDGPRFEFTQLLGVSRIWDGPRSPGERCRSCGGATKQPSEYCIDCDKSGRDDSIPKPSPSDMDKRREPRAYKPSNKKGGLAGKK